MNIKEKKLFIKQHIKEVERKIIFNINKMPDNWEGVELKKYISDCFLIPNSWLTSTKKKNYNNDILINNL